MAGNSREVTVDEIPPRKHEAFGPERTPREAARRSHLSRLSDHLSYLTLYCLTLYCLTLRDGGKSNGGEMQPSLGGAEGGCREKSLRLSAETVTITSG
ncbi:Uncharacterized protein DAT39_023062 [Clarias magur]|uniref:Uncharacterized protein n=1 Tax=Clarias magur TaxID=1594786 RepID=A0A8J4T1H6_CLAMG|nr:Uncharacterized protein DAT39_023062 [Clarias magur]